MTAALSSEHAIAHPAPQRDKAQPLLLLFALLGAPVAWLGQLLFGFAVTSYVCDVPGHGAGWAPPAITALNLLALVVGAAGLIAATTLFRATRHEHDGAAEGVVEAGEGRTRFLAVWGIWASAVFIVATLANTASLFLVPLCRS